MGVREDFVVTSPFPDMKVPEDVDVGSYIMRNFHNYPNRTALIDANTEVSISYGELEDLIENVAANLVHAGYQPHQPVVMFMSNSLEYLIIPLAVWRLGGYVACINGLLQDAEVHSKLSMVNSEILICDENTVKVALKAVKSTTIRNVFCSSTKLRHGCSTLTSLFKPRGHATRFPLNLRHVNPRKDTCLVLFSSGTTGLPKGVRLSHRCLTVSCRLFGGPEIDQLSKHHGIVYQPLSHVYGIALAFAHLYWGKTCIIMPKFTLQTFIQLIAEYRVDQLHLVPPIMVQLSQSDIPKQYDLSCLRSISSGAAPLSEEVEEQVARVVGNQCQIRQSFGLTEAITTTVHHTLQPGQRIFPADRKYHKGSIGYPIPGMVHKVIDIRTGKILGPNNEGELCVKSDAMMLGYLNNPEATERTIDPEGWLHTGDIAYYNEDGCFFVVDRLKELIKYKGYQVAPAELEAILLGHGEVVDAGVVGMHDAACGELPFAWVVRKPDSVVTESQIHTYVDEKVAAFKRLRGGIRFVEVIPKSASGKILRRNIRSTESRLRKGKLLTSKL